jgi:hypothetical protein
MWAAIGVLAALAGGGAPDAVGGRHFAAETAIGWWTNLRRLRDPVADPRNGIPRAAAASSFSRVSETRDAPIIVAAGSGGLFRIVPGDRQAGDRRSGLATNRQRVERREGSSPRYGAC